MEEGKHRTTIKDVAQCAGISVATVSAVLNKTRFVSDELAERALKAARKLDYYPNRLARGLKIGKTHTVAYIVPNISNLFFARVAKGVQNVLQEDSYTVSLHDTDFSEKKLFHHLTVIIGNRVDGIIMSAWHSPGVKEAISLVQNMNIPLVIVYSPRDQEKVDSILIDDEEGGYLSLIHI